MGIVMNDYRQAANAIEAKRARVAAKALDDALGSASSADALELDGSWYVVTSGTGEGYDFAYDPCVVGHPDNFGDGWDYSAWCAETSPVEDRSVAAAYYLLNDGALLGTSGSCQPVLSDDDRELLDLARRVLA